MKNITFFALCLGVFLTVTAAPASAQMGTNEFVGYWLTENQRSVIEIERCEQGLCGNIHWIIEGGMQFDEKNPDAAKRATPMCDMPILWGFRQVKANEWSDGRIYKADDGDTYRATLAMLPTGKLLVRGYLGMPLFGKSQVWTRVSDENYPPCRAP